MTKIKETENFRVTKKNEAVRIVKDENDPNTMIDPITIPDLLTQISEKYASNMAFMYKETMSSGEWKGITFKEYRDRVIRTAKIFIKLGLEKHDVVAVLAFNSVEWFISAMATIHAGGIIAGIYTTNSVDACRHILESSKAKIVIVDDAKQMEKIYELKNSLPNLKVVIQTLAPYANYVMKKDGYWRWNELEKFDVSDMNEKYQKRSSEIYVNECCCLVYTSGTVGPPKAVMLSHDNLTFDTKAILTRFSNLCEVGKESLVSYLPLSHAAGFTVDMIHMLTIAGTVYFADRDALKGTLVKTLVDAQPTCFLGVPRVYEKIQEKMLAAAADFGMVKKAIGNWAKDVTLQHHMDQMSGKYSSSIQYKLATQIVINKVKQALGLANMKIMVNGGAPLNIETRKYFLSLDLKIIDGYGMSEASGCHTFTTNTTTSLETSGQSLPGTMMKIYNANNDGQGEICMKGRNVFMGYLNDEDKTKEAIDDEGWLHSGDLGYIDHEGYLYITGRLKELIITAGGENIPPVIIENVVKNECSAISNAFLIGDKKKYLTVLMSLKTEMDREGAPMDDLAPVTLKWLEGMNLTYTNLSEILNAGPDAKVMQALTDVINKVNEKSVSNAQKIQKFAIMPHDFSIRTGELGQTMKVKRNVVLQMYKEIIENLYK